MEIVTMKVEELNPCPYNPREISTVAREGLKTSIKTFGLREPLIVNKRNNNVVGGNQRLSIITELGYDEVQVSLVDLDDEMEEAFNMALNNEYIQGRYTITAKKLIEKLKENHLALYDGLMLNKVESDLSGLLEKTKASDHRLVPELELQPFEHYDYLLIVSETVQDWNWLRNKFKLGMVNASPVGSRKIGRLRAVKFKDFHEALFGKKPEEAKEEDGEV